MLSALSKEKQQQLKQKVNDNLIYTVCSCSHVLTRNIVSISEQGYENKSVLQNTKKPKENVFSQFLSTPKVSVEIFWGIVNRANFHFCPLSRVAMALPVFPDDAVSIRLVYTVVIQSVQVGAMAEMVPPGAFV